MIPNIDPQYTKMGQPDVPYDINSEPFRCYDRPPSTVFLVPEIRMLNGKHPHTWDYFSIGSNFWDIIKNQVHIFSSMYVDFGLVLSQREIPYYMWNAYTNKSVYILEPVAIGDYGTTFVVDIAGNFTLQPGKGTPATLTVFTEGPISSATDFEITTTVEGLPAYTYTIKTIATRVIVFPFWADWSKKVEYRLKFATVISKSTQNSEQRRPLMTKPQRSLAFTHLDKTYGLITNSINFAQDKSIGIPIVYELFQIVSLESDKMGMTIRESTDELWNLKRFCNYVLLYDLSNGTLVAKKITSITTNKIFIENPILETFPNIDSVVGFPMIIGVFSSAKPTVLNGNLVSWDLSLSELIGENQPALSGVPVLPSSLDTKFDWEEKVSFEQTIYREIGEFLGTAQAIYSQYPLNKNSLKPYTGTFLLKSRAQLFSFLDFVCGAKGRAKKFEYLWPLNEFQLIQGEYEGVSQVRVRNNYYAEQFSKVVNKKVRVCYRNFVLNTTVTSVSTNSAHTTLTFANPTTFRIYDDDCDIFRIEQWKTVRFDIDDFSIECLSGTVFRVTVRMMEVYE